ncbi:MAG TPA: TonB-dependent receptor [Flavobacteriales bacterium]|nr:TonB-dependent receptor [Flavobacteriales bacterium]
MNREVSLIVRFLTAILPVLAAASAYAQNTCIISGKITDSKDSAVPFASVKLRGITDSTIRKGTTTDEKGVFQFEPVPKGEYSMRISSIGFNETRMKIDTKENDTIRLSIKPGEDAKVLNQVNIVVNQERASQKGDTAEYNANAYKVNPDATVEDLVKKMPGITIENGTVKAQGEDVKKVTIDGKEFFGDDAMTALKNLPAEIVDKVQVFDKASEQSEFTGFNDGNTEKTINIKTRGGRINGTFGKVYAGYGTDERYNAGGNFNYFKGDRRISLLGMSNNINQQNFTSQDLLGVSQSSQGGGGSRSSGSWQGGGGGREGGSGRYQQSPSSSFLTGSQSGINTTHSFGINYNDLWNKKWKVTGSYFFNATGNTTNSTTSRNYFLPGSTNQLYTEEQDKGSDNFNHRGNLRIEWNIDSLNSIILTPKISFQDNRSGSALQSITTLSENAVLSTMNTSSSAKNNGYSLSSGLLFRHRFHKRGRSLSAHFNGDVSEKNGESFLYSSNVFYTGGDTTIVTDQRTTTASGTNDYWASFNYTEPVGKNAQLMFSYSPAYTVSQSTRLNELFNNTADSYNLTDSVLSNDFTNEIVAHKGGVSYRYNIPKMNFNVGADYLNRFFNNQQTFPSDVATVKTFESILPQFMMQYKFSSRTNFRFNYRTNAQAPSISQLQNVINNSNPLLLSSGNPDLNQQYNHTITGRFSTVDTTKTKPLFFLLSGTFSESYIGNSSIVATNDTLLAGGVVLYSGSQFTQPVNINGYYNLRTFVTYGTPVKFLKSNLNLNAGFTHNRTPSLINNQVNYSRTYNVNGGFILGSNISEKIDFSVSYSANYNVVRNSVQPSLDNNYYTGVAGAKINLLIKNHFVVATDVNYNHYQGLGAGFNQQIFLWNGALAYKFLKNNAGEFRVLVYDILKQNNSIVRNVTETYVEDVQTNILQRYGMVQFTYTFRNVKGRMPGEGSAGNRPHGERRGGDR